MYTAGPGPGAYRLPTTVGFQDHDPSRNRNPMYSFGINAGARFKQLGPGPAYRVDCVVSSPAWSFGARFPQRSTMRTPGPGAHAPEKCPPTRDPRAPAYSMGARLGFALKRPGPAPNAYALQMGPGSPAYTMGARVGFSLKPKSPGPAVYFQQDADVYCARAPVYSMGARSAGAGKPTKSPGPAAYPPDLYNTKKNPYKYSFGTKHGDYAPPMIIKEDTMDCL
ncbi:outer dense fiber protein 3-like isoform X2 [Leptidea sinapis]|uniref:outer dense fiber protein 3-like isoform X2 n=1 Tax=Leptidea sinapis TaxID=189913 RepID=UPI002127C591|nr:outer dense fiber protein 3-like isoform X2 [Leptidea sinapis]